MTIKDAPPHPRFKNLEYETIKKESFTKDDCEKNRLELIDPEFYNGTWADNDFRI